MSEQGPEPVPVNQPVLGERERQYILECLSTGWISSEGPFVSRFEEAFATRCGRRFGVAVTNGTAALEAALAALALDPGAEVILPSFTIISCAGAIVKAGAVPVVVDCDPLTWTMDTSQVAARISRRTRAIMVVHIYGLPVNMDPILELARQHDLAVIEDAAESIGQTYGGRPCGSFGVISTVSFYPNKHITTGEGGMVLTDDPHLAERCRSLRNLCFQPQRRFVHEELGWNLRMTNLQAALGLAQLEQLDHFLDRKRRIGRRYQYLLADCPGIQRPVTRIAKAENLYWVYGVVLDDSVSFDAAEAMRRLARRGIGTRPFFWPMHEQPVFRRRGLFADEVHPVAERIARRGFYLPSGLALTEGQIERSAAELREILS